MLSLRGRLSHIDKYGKLVFTCADASTKYKLSRACRGDVKPFDGDKFYCFLAQKSIPDDIKELVGQDCVLKVKTLHYNFVSKLERNLGERVSGTRLRIVDIQKYEQV